MKKYLFILFLLFTTVVEAQTFSAWRYRSSSDCTGLTGGKAQDLCKDTDDGELYVCLPSSGDCDTAGEWVQIDPANAATATALAANGANCSAGNAPLGVDASGAVESCFDVATQTELNAITLSTLTDVNTTTATTGRILVADGTDFESTAIYGDITLAGSGEAAIQANSVVLGTDTVGGYAASSTEGGSATTVADADFGEITVSGGSWTVDFVGTPTATAGNLLIADGTDYEGVAMSGDISITSAGVTAVVADTIALSDLSDVNTTTASNGRILVSDGTDFESTAIYGDVTLAGSGEVKIGDDKIQERMLKAVDTPSDEEYLTYEATVGDFEWQTAAGGASQLSDLTDVNTSTVTAGRIFVADGTDWESVAMSGSCTMGAGGVISCSGSATSLTDLTDVNSTTATAGRVLVADGTDWESIAITNATLDSTGLLKAPMVCTKTVCASTTNINANKCDYIADGTADDVQIQAAIDAVYAGSATGDTRGGGSGKGSVCLSEGTFDLNASVNVYPGIMLKGQGLTGTKVRAESAITNMFQFTEPTWAVKTGTISTVGSSTTITGSGTAFTTDFAVGDWIATATTGTNGRKITAIASATSLTVDTAVDLSSGGPYTPYQNPTVAGIKIQDMFISGASLATTAFDSKANVIPLWDVQFVDVYVFDTTGNAIVIDSPWGFRFLNSHIEDNGGWGLVINQDSADTKDDGPIIQNAKIIQNNSGGIQLNDVSGAIISANEIQTDGANTYAVEIQQGSLVGGNGNMIIGNKIFDTNGATNDRGIFIDTGATANVVIGNIFRGLTSTAEIDNSGTNTVIANNRGDDEANTDFIQNTINFTDGVVTVNSDSDSTGNFLVNSNAADVLLGVDVANGLVKAGAISGGNYAQFDADGDLSFTGTADYLVADSDYAFRAAVAENAGVWFGNGGYHFRDTSANTQMYVSATSTNVGIGTSVPSTNLHVVGGARVTGLVSCDTIDTDSNGVLACGSDNGAGSSGLVDLTDVASATVTAGRMLIADGTDWESVAITGDIAVTGAGAMTVTADTISLSDLSDVNTTTATLGRILVSDGTDFESVALRAAPCVVIENLAAADDNFPLGSKAYPRTITQVGCRCHGTCTTKANIALEDDSGNAMTHTTPTCAVTGAQIVYQSVTAAGSLASGEGLRMDVTNAVSPETDKYEVCWDETYSIF